MGFTHRNIPILGSVLLPGDEKISVKLENSTEAYDYLNKYSIIPIEGDFTNPGTIRLDLSKNITPTGSKNTDPAFSGNGIEFSGLINGQDYHFRLTSFGTPITLTPITITNFTLSDKSLTDNHNVASMLDWSTAPLKTLQTASKSISFMAGKFRQYYAHNTKMFYYNNHLILLGRGGDQGGLYGAPGAQVIKIFSL